MRKYLFILLGALSIVNIYATNRYPLGILEFEKHGSRYNLIEEQAFRYDADTNVVESIRYQILSAPFFYDEDDAYSERKYMTEHIISEYNEQGCYHSVEYSREKWDHQAVDEDTILRCTEYFYDILDSGGSRTICLTENDSTVSLFDAYCRLLGSQTFDRKTGELMDYEEVTWSSDSLQMWSVSKNERNYTRYWYDSNGAILKQHEQYYERHKGKWKCISNLWGRPHYTHGFVREDTSMVICPVSTRTKFNKEGDVISGYSVTALACLIPFSCRYFYEYVYIDDASVQKSNL